MALQLLKQTKKSALPALVRKGLFVSDSSHGEALERMQLSRERGLKGLFWKILLKGALIEAVRHAN
jgi:hypothetical protein